MKKIYLILALTLTITVLNAQTFNFEWANSISGNSYYEEGHGIGVDANNNMYIASTFADTADVDPTAGISNVISNGGKDVVIQKQDENGNVIWTRHIGGSSDDEVFDMVVDPLGNSYTLGSFTDSVDFDPSTNDYYVDGEYHGIFILKLDNNGNFMWVTYLHSNSLKYGYDIALNKTNTEVLVTGYFSYSLTVSSNSGDQTFSSSGSYDTFVIKFDNAGNTVLATKFGGSDQEVGYGIACDNNKNIYITGYISGTANLDPNGTYEITSNYWDAYINKLDSSGNFLWAKSIGGTEIDAGKAVVCDNSNNVFFIGHCKDSVDLNPNSGEDIYYYTADYLFVEKLSSTGDYLWGFGIEAGSSKPEKAVLKNNALYICGITNGNSDFDTDTNSISATGINGTYIVKYFGDGTFDKLYGNSATTPYGIAVTNNGESVYTTGRFKNTVDFDPNGTSFEMTALGSYYDTYILKLHDCMGTNTVINETACDSYTSPSGNYIWTNSGTYTDTLMSQYGCDSMITINLTIANSTGTDVQTACNSYTWIDGNTYTTDNNTATYTLTNSQGCDSVVTLNLTIINLDNTITQNNDSLTANQSGTTYQWIDCDNNTAITGETSQTFIATATGNYAVVIDNGTCSDTSNCINVIVSGIDKVENSSIKIYPNPAHNQLIISSKQSLITNIEILDITGKIVLSEIVNEVKQSVNIEKLQNGVYFLKVQLQDKTEIIKFIIQ